MIKYYCKICDQYIDKNMRDKNENKCLICKSRLKKIRNKIEQSNDLKFNEKYTDEKGKYENNNVSIESKIYWCKTHNIPLYKKECKLCKQSKLTKNIKYMSTDVRPVFPEERLLLSVLIDDITEDELLQSSVWYGANKYIINGNTLELTKGELMKDNLIHR